jgi:mitotic spindle assembly checkpoint protein MAD1
MDSSPFIEKPQDPLVEVHSLNFQIKELQSQISIERIQHEDQVNSLQKDLEKVLVEKGDFQKDQIYYYNLCNEIRGKLEHVMDNFAIEREKYEDELKALRSKAQGYKEKADDLISATGDVSRLTQQSLLLTSSLDQEKKVNASLQDEISGLHQQLNQLKHIVQLKDQNIEDLKTRDFPSKEEITETQLISKQLSEQITYIKELEHKNLQQSDTIKSLQLHKANIEIISNENKELQTKLKFMDKLKDELDNSNLELLALKQEQSKWSIYVGDETKVEELVKSYKSLKDENLILQNNLSKSQLELKTLQGKYNDLFISNETSKQETAVAKKQLDNIIRINKELEQQRDLAFEESNYLREQLKVDDNDMTEYTKNLESLVDGYKTKLDDLTKSIPKEVSNKRAHPEDSLKELQKIQALELKNNELETNISQLQNESALLIKKLECIEDLKEQKIRILQMRDNPFLNFQIVKQEELALLKNANNELLGSIEGETIPKGVYQHQQFTVNALEKQVEGLQKKNQRLIQQFQKKSQELLDTINTIFGYRLSYMNDKIKLVSKYCKGSLIIDPKEWTFKRNGDDEFVRKCDDLIGYWIKEKGEVSCFLGALAIELYSSL